MADSSQPSPDLPPDLEDALADAFWRDPEHRDQLLEELIRARPDHTEELHARYARLLREAASMGSTSWFDVNLGLKVAGQAYADADEDLSGTTLGGKYRVIRRVGKGGFGFVYEAVDERLGAPVAVKVLNRRALSHPEALGRFLGEAKLLTNLDHPNIVRWITFDTTAEGTHYFVMEFLAGEELSKLLRRKGRLSSDRTLNLLLQILAGLRAAHCLPDGTSLFHLDLKPQNVFVLPGDHIKVIDFGMSQHVGAAAREAAGVVAVSSVDEASSVDLRQTVASQPGPVSTKPGAGGRSVKRARGGTLLYTSPEHCRHLAGHADIVALDGRSDLYSLGIIAFEMLAGEHPFQGCVHPAQIIAAHLATPPPKLGTRGVKAPRKLIAFVERCLEKDRNARFASAGEAHAVLNRIANPPPLWPKLVAAAVIVAAILLGWSSGSGSEARRFDVVAADGRVYFGPERPTSRLAVRGLREVGPASVQLVEDPHSDKRLEGWEVKLERRDEGHQLLIDAPALDRTVATSAYVRVGESGALQHSQPITLIYLAGDAWQVLDADVRGREGRVLDPKLAELRVVVAADKSHIKSVRVVLDGEERQLGPEHAQDEGKAVTYALPFSRFEIPDTAGVRHARLEIVVTDQADRERIVTQQLTLDTRGLEIESPALTGCAGSRGLYTIYPDSEPALTFRTNRTLDWREHTRLSLDQVVQVRLDDGSPLDVGLEPTPEGVRLRLPNDRGGPYSGSIVISVDDAHHVFHKLAERGTARATLPFHYQTEKPELTAQPMGLDPVPGVESVVYFTNQERVSVDLRAVHLVVEAVCSHDGEPLQTERVDFRLKPADTVDFHLPADGVYDFVVRAFRRLGGDPSEREKPDSVKAFVVVRDTTVPELRWVDGPDSVVLDPTESGFALGVSDANVGSHGTPVDLQWEILRSSEPLRSGRLERFVAPAASTVALDWADLFVDHAELTDGFYELRVTGRDAAGNQLRAPRRKWEIAHAGPKIRRISPSEGDWSPIAGNSFRVIVHAEDPNGVASVTCQAIVHEEGFDRTLSLKPGTDRRSSEWSEVFVFPARCSGKPVELIFESEDRYQNPGSVERGYVSFVKFSVQRPTRVSLRLADARPVEVAPMRLLEKHDRYSYRGRTHREEQAAFRSHGVAVDARWQTQFERLEEFYLDETEVTVAQYFAFVEAEDGYRAGDNWADSTGRRESRRERLRQALERVEDDRLPVTGIDWDEASAYARWVGKRLPTHVEWEYAVRGGAEYRPYSCAVVGAELDKTKFNVDVDAAGQGRAAWPVGEGGDVTPPGTGAGLRNLCSNVSEWTSTPRRGGYIAAGANYRSLTYHFLVAIPRARTARLPTLGFRCAMDAQAMDGVREDRPGTRLRVQQEAGPVVRERR